MRRPGIAFAVYAQDSGTERLIPFDLVPRINRASARTMIERGLQRRVHVIHRRIDDDFLDPRAFRLDAVAFVRRGFGKMTSFGRLSRRPSMTDCVAIELDGGVIFAADSCTNAGVDPIARFSEMRLADEVPNPATPTTLDLRRRPDTVGGA